MLHFDVSTDVQWISDMMREGVTIIITITITMTITMTIPSQLPITNYNHNDNHDDHHNDNHEDQLPVKVMANPRNTPAVEET